MLYILIALVSIIAASGIGAIGSIYGARFGSEKSMQAIMETIKEQKREENEQKEKERVERVTYIQSIISTFITREMKENFSILDLTGEKNLPIGTNFILKFDEYEKTKYVLLENPTRAVREINKLYAMFYEITNMNSNNQIQDKLKKMDEIIEEKDTIEILLSDVKYMKNT